MSFYLFIAISLYLKIVCKNIECELGLKVLKRPVADLIKLFFSFFLLFNVKLDHFTVNDFFIYVTNT